MSKAINKLCHYEDGKLIRCSKNKIKTIKNHFCQHCGGDLRKPVPIEPGMFGKFFDLDIPAYRFDYLRVIDEKEQFSYVDMDGNYWECFKPGLPAKKIEVPEPDED